MCQEISASVDGGPRGGSRVNRPGFYGPPSALAEIFIADTSFIYKNDDNNDVIIM
jgi:hypothetical protein